MRLKPHVWIIIIGCYILLQFLWWAELLNNLYQENIGLKILLNPDMVDKLIEEGHSKTLMVYGETAVFSVLSVLGLFFLYRANKRERDYVERQNNFFLSITHELKTPLSAIKLRLQTLLSRKLDTDKQYQILQQTLDNNNRLEELIEAILYTKSLDSKNIHLNKTEHNLSKNIAEIAERFKAQLPSGKNNLFSFLNKEGINATHDSVALNLIVSNLLDNAFKYSNPSKNGVVSLSLRKDKDLALVEITDCGSPIPKEEKQKIFQKFYRMGSEKTRTSKGTGLGLYIVKSLCKLHNIEIKLQTSENGNTFTLYLKLHGK